jgi:23S rRNA pseudouridine2604 synthase
MHIELDMPPGKWRDLTADELSELNRLVEHSTKTFEE